jgi:TetR/AcrR family transcriptional repressor of nem operon
MGRPKGFDPDAAITQAMEVFWRKGYATTSPRDLLEAIGIGKGSLYNTFGSKHQLFMRALYRYRELVTSQLLQTLEGPEPVKDRLRAALESLVEIDMADPARRGCLAINTAVELAGTDEEATAVVRRILDREEEALRAAIEEGRRSGELGEDLDAAAVASMLVGTIAGLRVLAKTAQSPQRLHRIIDATLDLL